jgi:hypothetical protein
MSTRYLSELIFQKKMFDQKIKELKPILSQLQTDKIAEELRAALELRQGLLLRIKAANEASKLVIGGTEVAISVAVVLRDTLVEQIDIITDLIEDPECTLDKVDLQRKRDRYYEEYTLLSMAILRNDLTVTVE